VRYRNLSRSLGKVSISADAMASQILRFKSQSSVGNDEIQKWALTQSYTKQSPVLRTHGSTFPMPIHLSGTGYIG
jgi:hypothetical protein